jgi:methionine biosynthesis protein MetW
MAENHASTVPPAEYQYIIDLVEPGSRVLDLGCGSGELLKALQVEKRVRAEGIEVSEELIRDCVAKGLFVFHGDLDEGLADFNDQSVDYVIATNTLQVLHRPAFLLKEMARVGRNCIVSVPNFAYWRVRTELLLRGSMPRSPRLPYEWYDSPNIHHTTIKDFRAFCKRNELKLLRETDLRTLPDGSCQIVRFLPNLFADYAIFMFQGVAPVTE